MLAVLRSNDTRVNTNINREFKSVLTTFRWFYHEKKTVLILIALVHTRTVPWLKMTLSKWRWDAAEKMQVLSFVWPWWINSVRCYLLLVISKINCVPFYTLAFILLLLQLEDMLDKELLQRFISVINAQLLEGVRLETLKPKDIQQANCITQTWIAFSFLLAILAPWYCRIDLVNNPRKQSTIDAWMLKLHVYEFSIARVRTLINDTSFQTYAVVYTANRDETREWWSRCHTHTRTSVGSQATLKPYF